ncbi:OprD family porin [Sulfurimonas crateris]|uniref:OprD family porin n=1 Tax=Sulfurimonas crateris TaxID=2574727 RepID=A0A4U2ZCI9_9BACT|nr:OprD family outer membrane porin [Sulfurimonas crateris]TKI71310.1 OprD family porin [Sulfurimonas crateris]
MIKISVAAAAVVSLLVSSAFADDTEPKRVLKNNMMEVYKTLPSSVDNLSDAFTEGTFYGRLRMNAFNWDWKNDQVNDDNKAFGIGGSMIYKTAPLHGVSATAGLYYANNPFSSLREDDADVGDVKAGKDTFSRYNVKTSGDWSMAVLAQAYLQYDLSKTSFKVGRQIFESFLTKSNDTKMIPNTFEGYTVTINEIPKTRIRGAYFNSQKLRDHTTFHDVLTFKDSSGESWNNNDDAAVHKGLNYTNLSAHGKEENELVVVDLKNKSIDNLVVDVTYGSVPGLLSSLTGEFNYKIKLGDKLSLTPGVRHMQQFDNGAGEIGGASLDGSLAGLTGAKSGYKDASTLDTSLTMARLVLTDGIFKAQVGYSAVADEADIVAPWRGFPTGGYTRAMAQYNWRADTKTTSAEVYYDFGKAKILDGFSALARYAIQDFDEDKQAGGVQADSNILHIDFRQQFTPTFDAKIRMAFVDADERVADGIDKDSYNEYRFELNYLF